MSKSAERLEHEVEASRDRLENPLADLQSRLTTSNLAQDLVGRRSPRGTVKLTVEGLASTIRMDPVPVVLVGAGLAFLVYDAVQRRAERSRQRFLSDKILPRSTGGKSSGNHPDRLEDKLEGVLEESTPSVKAAVVVPTRCQAAISWG